MKIQIFATEITERTEIKKNSIFSVTSVYSVARFFN